MDGNDAIRVVLTSRDLELLRALVITRILDCEQVRTVAGFGSIRRANARLLLLSRAGLLKRWFVASRGGAPKALYGLSVRGAKAIGEGLGGVIPWKQGELIITSQFLAHQQAINSVFLTVRYPGPASEAQEAKWLTFKTPLSSAVPLIPDAYLEITRGDVTYPIFLEVDRGTEPLKTWDKKAALYLKLAATREFEHLFQRERFRVAAIVSSEGRLKGLRRTVAKHTDKLFWFTTLERIKRDGFVQASWVRPIGEAEVGLC